MENVKDILTQFALGVSDAIFGTLAVYKLHQKESKRLKEPLPPQHLTVLDARRAERAEKKKPETENPFWGKSVCARILQCILLNGIVLGAGYVIFKYVILNLMNYLVHLCIGNSSQLAATVWSWTESSLNAFFESIYVMPMFLLSKLVNSLYFMEIADKAYNVQFGRSVGLPNVSKLIADTLFSVLIQALFLLQSTLFVFLPITILGQIISTAHTSLLYSLYAFEYRWLNKGWELHKRLSLLENNWPYYVGFGLPLAILTALPNYFFMSACVFSILFPLLIVSSLEARQFSGPCPYPLKWFAGVVRVSNILFNMCKAFGRCRLFKTRGGGGALNKIPNTTPLKSKPKKKNESSFHR